ncbi:MAG: alkaline phosphatase family protein [Chloroflexota bacterium]
MTTLFAMQATASEFEREIRQNRLMDVAADWADELIFPHYDGLSIYNVSQTVQAIFGLQSPQPLDARVWNGSVPDVDRVFLFLTDGLGYLFLRELIADDPKFADIIGDISDGRGVLPLSSVAPSTTAVALPVLWSASKPAQTGMIGTLMFLRELSMLSDVLFFKPGLGRHAHGTLSQWGLEAETFVPVSSLPQRLADSGIATHLVLDWALSGTGLSRILHRGINQHHLHAGTLDFWLRLADSLQATRGQRCYISAYWPVVDTLSHAYGARSRYVINEVHEQMARLRDLLRDESVQDGRTLVMVIADHGHSDYKQTLDFSQEPGAAPIRNAMRLTFGAEARFGYGYLREGTRTIVTDTIQKFFSDQLTWIDGSSAVTCGLFGNSEIHPDLNHRVGDIIMVPREGTTLADASRPVKHRSGHGGLSEKEMLVPLLWKVI